MINKERLFYSETERILFYVPDYYVDANNNAYQFAKAIQEETKNFANTIDKRRLDNFKTSYIPYSSRYKRMRVFYIENVDAHSDAYTLSTENGWTMWKWLEN